MGSILVWGMAMTLALAGREVAPFGIGVTLAVAVWVFARITHFERDPSYYPVLLIVFAAYYVLFAIIGGSTAALLVESMAMSLFVMVAAVSPSVSRWLIVAGLAGHGLFDLVHGGLIVNPGVPPWWPSFCMAFDVVTAAAAGVAPLGRGAMRAQRIAGPADLRDADHASPKPNAVRRIARAIPDRPVGKSESCVPVTAQFGERNEVSRVPRG